MIRIQSLGLTLNDSRILTDISTEIAPSGITALIGPNGAGKSSLLHCVAGLTRPSTGGVRVDDLDILTAPDLERARTLAILTQSQAVSSRLKVVDLVGFGRWPHHQGRPSSRDHDIVDEALETFALGDLRDRHLDSLSGGQRQRAFVAMAHAQSTRWLLLDEPLNALDPRHAHGLMTRLHVMSRPGPEARAVVVVLHDLTATAAWADRVIALRDGRIAAAGACEAVMTEAILSDLFDTPFAVVEHAGRRLVFTKDA